MNLLLRPFRFVLHLSVLLFSFLMVCSVVFIVFFLILFLSLFLIVLMACGLFLNIIARFLKVLSDP